MEDKSIERFCIINNPTQEQVEAFWKFISMPPSGKPRKTLFVNLNTGRFLENEFKIANNKVDWGKENGH